MKRLAGGHKSAGPQTPMLTTKVMLAVALACPLFFNIPHCWNKLRSVINHHEGSL